jgi:MFS transporter, DHA1 family, tetracycline resistance protein
VATAYITDISDEAVRPARFGYFHAMFGVGFVIGPVLGGILGDVWVRAPFLAAAVLNGLNFALAVFLLPESRPGGARVRFAARDLNPFRPLGWALGFTALVPLIAIYLMLNFVGTMYGTLWALFGGDTFQWSSSMVGLSLGAFGVCHAGAQALLTGPAVARLGERGALVTGMAFELLALAVLGFATRGWIVFAIAPLFALGGIGMPALQALTTAKVGPEHQGQLQGVLSSLVSLAAVIGPLFFSAVYFAVKPTWPGAVWLVGGGVYLLALPLMLGVRR